MRTEKVRPQTTQKKRKRLNDDSEEPPSDSDGSDYDADGDDYLDSEEDDDILLMAGTKDRPATKRVRSYSFLLFNHYNTSFVLFLYFSGNWK